MRTEGCAAGAGEGGRASDPGNEVQTEDAPSTFAAGEPYTLALLIRWMDTPGTEGIFRSGPSSDGNWLWMTNSRRLWGRHAGVDSPSSGSGPALTAGWQALVRVWDGREVRQYVNGIRTSTTAATATGAWTLHRLGWQYFTSQRLSGAYAPFFGAFGAAWDDAMVARWSANPLGMLSPDMDVPCALGDGSGGHWRQGDGRSSWW